MKTHHVRWITTLLIERAKEEVLSWESIGRACLRYMSEDEVADMARREGLIEETDEDDDEQLTDQGD